MFAAIVGTSCVAVVLIVAYIIRRLIQKSDDDQAEKFDRPQLPPNKWRIRKKNGAWLVSRRVWWIPFGYRDMAHGRDMRYTDRYYYAAPTWEIAFDYCRRRDMKEGK